MAGSGSQWSVGGFNGALALNVGFQGTGTLKVEDGGVVSAANVTVADNRSATGTINLNGGGTLITGQVSEGPGTGGGTVTFDDGTLQLTGDQVALFDGFEIGEVTLAAGGGTIDTQAFTVASATALSGTGGLTKLGTGSLTLTGTNTYSGKTTVRDGTLAVEGSMTHSAADLTVADQVGDNSTLEVSGGGVVSNRDGTLGSTRGSEGTATVTGANSQWNNSSDLRVGHFGTGTLNVEAGGVVSSSSGVLGFNGMGLATVTGANSQWNNSGALRVGSVGSGTLNVEAGGVVSNTEGYVGFDSSRSLNASTATVTGADSRWNNSGSLTVGNLGTGTLNVGSGGVVSAADVTVSGSRSATGTINLNGGGTLITGQVSEGTGTGGGTVTFDGGTLQLSGNQADLFSGFEAGDVTLAAGGGTIDTQAFTVGSASDLSGAGGLSKMGVGSLALTGTQTYTGATNIDAGSLFVEGSLANTAVTVASSATLGGSGSIAGSVTVQRGGTLSPGSSPGILTIGSLNLQSGSTTSMEINGLTPGTEHDQIVVNGNASLDGTLNLTYGYAPSDGDSFTLIDANSITGDFSEINNILNNAMVFNVTITDDYIFEVIASQANFTSFVIEDSELMKVVTVIDRSFDLPSMVPLVNELNLLHGSALPLAFQQISPQELTVLESFTFANARLVSTRLKNRQRDVRNGVTGFSTAGFNLYDESGQQIRNSLLADAAQVLPAGTQTQPLSFESGLSSYISGSGTTRDFDGSSAGPGYEDDSFSILLGADYRLDDNLAIGAYHGYNHTDADLQEDGGDADLDSFRLGFTGTYWNPLSDTTSYYTSVHLGFAHHEYDTKRNAFGGVASGDTEAFEIDLGTAIGYEINLRDDLLLTTELSLDYINLDMDGFTESGSDAPLVIQDDRSESFYSTLSFRLDYSFENRGVDFLPYIHAGWRHEYLDDSNSVSARFAASPGVGGFTVEGASVASDSLVGGFGLGAEVQEGLILQLGYHGELNSDFESHSLLGSINYKF